LSGVVAIIPARGGSRRVPSKNLLPLAGLPVVAHSIRHALAADAVETVYVSTDDPEIAAVARAEGATVVERPAAIATDRATSESALLHVLDTHRAQHGQDPELVVFLQATSPIRHAGDIDAAIALLRSANADSVFSAVRDRGLMWQLRDDGPEPLNYEPGSRPREQDMAPQYRENGSIYVFKPWVLREHGHRMAGRSVVYEMDTWTSFQLDTPEDAELLEWIARRPGLGPMVDWPERVDLVVFDFDGVMTDNRVLVRDDGDEAVLADRGDGWGIARLRDAGVPMLVLSTEEHPVVAARCRKLRIECHQGVGDKAGYLRELLAKRGVDSDHVVYVGNDVNDLGAMDAVGIPVAVGDAHPEVAAAARIVLTKPGGRGAVRELCDGLLRALRR
jgi:YrbI family 3-deoxy-D-manno-octulosonate 8-phosphate phosphatase